MNLDQVQAMDQCLRHLITAASTTSLYAAEHPQVKKYCRQAHVELVRALGAEEGLSLLRVDDQLAVEGHPLERSLYAERFALLLKRQGIGHLRFLRGVEEGELLALAGGLVGKQSSLRSSQYLRFGQVEVRHRVDGNQGQLAADARRAFGDIGQEELARVIEIYESVRKGRPLQVVGLAEIVSGFIDIFAGHADPLLTLVPLRDMDEYTFTHSLNVCLLNLAQASALGIEGELLHDIGLAAMLHDIGKLFIPVEILNKPTPLTDKEFELVRQHPLKGAEYLLGNPGVPRLAVISAYEHHLHYDLRGYPKVKGHWQQNLCSQMTTIADIYDSLRTRRPYRQPLEVEVVLDRIRKLRGSQLHPLLADNFLTLMYRVHPEFS